MDSNKSTQLPHLPQPFSDQRPTPPPNSPVESISSDTETLGEGLWMKGKGKDRVQERHPKGMEQNRNPGSPGRAPPPPLPGIQSNYPLDVDAIALSKTHEPASGNSSAPAGLAGWKVSTLAMNKWTDAVPIAGDRTSTNNVFPEESYEELYQVPPSSLAQRPVSGGPSSPHSQGQSPAEIQVKGRTLWNRKKEESDTLELMDAPDAAALEELRSALSIHVHRPTPGTPQGDNVITQDRLEPNPQRITRSVTRVASPAMAPGRTNARNRCGSWESAVERAGIAIYATEHQPRQEHYDSPATTIEDRPDQEDLARLFLRLYSIAARPDSYKAMGLGMLDNPGSPPGLLQDDAVDPDDPRITTHVDMGDILGPSGRSEDTNSSDNPWSPPNTAATGPPTPTMADITGEASSRSHS
ncbi:Uncharacterized protein TPAR_05432 [Tolypocladium paradoxum]|uniref:Uncharacterized protein n=1 Tax=Tolypocladium paradoxum TaxID=94208 RepID=A0A2S4KVZ9_9HYPO|nr:Uncharacterized protein TPAR_05432 [Tolypocladium paradoxum]